MKTVHFGAGSIGRGFVGALLIASGYEVVFVDVDEQLIEALERADGYVVREAGPDGPATRIEGFRALHSPSDAYAVEVEIATADVVTTAVGVRMLGDVAPIIARGIERRLEIGEDAIDGGRLAVIACENAINATDLLAADVRNALPESDADALGAMAVFANAAIDRIVPTQDPAAGLDVTLEPFFEWVVERGPFDGDEPRLDGVHWVDDLAPFIERKLFTVNAGHATAAYHGHVAGFDSAGDAIRDARIRAEVQAVIGETAALLTDKHGLDADELRAYGTAIIGRLANPDLADTTARIGRGPLRKLSRQDRFIGPAAQLAERGLPHAALMRAIAAALAFDVPGDAESVELRRILTDSTPAEAVERITGVPTDHPLHPELIDVFTAHTER